MGSRGDLQPYPIAYDVVEIGLGNNKTFLDYLGGDQCHELRRLFSFLPVKTQTCYNYVGVDMVNYLIEELKEKYKPEPNLRLVHSAISNTDCKRISYYGVSKSDSVSHKNNFEALSCYDLDVITFYAVAKEDAEAEEYRDDDQVQHYLLNMGSTNTVNPYVEERYRHLMKEHHVRQLSYASLCKLYNIGETKILKIDAEGDESNIIRGLIEYCKEQEKIPDMPCPWPWVIQVETNGLGDAKYGHNTEEEMLIRLQKEGYRVSVGSFAHNTILVRDEQGDCWIGWFEDTILETKCSECNVSRQDRGEGRYQWSRSSGEDGFWYCLDCWNYFGEKMHREREEWKKLWESSTTHELPTPVRTRNIGGNKPPAGGEGKPHPALSPPKNLAPAPNHRGHSAAGSRLEKAQGTSKGIGRNNKRYEHKWHDDDWWAKKA